MQPRRAQPFLTEELYIPYARFAGFESLPESDLGPLPRPRRAATATSLRDQTGADGARP